MSRTMPPLDLAAHVVERGLALGAAEVSAGVSEGSNVSLIRRDGKVEQASESSTRRLGISLLVDDRWSSHSTSDLRPDALETFLARAVAATKYLEPDPDRRLADGSLVGRGATEEALDHYDPAYDSWTADDRAALAEKLEGLLDAQRDDAFVSGSVQVSDGSGRHAQVASNGFSESTAGAWFVMGSEVTLSDEGGRRPEGASYYATRHLSDLPSVDRIVAETMERAREAVGSGPMESGKYPMILANRVARRILGTLMGPLSGGSIHHGRSCLADKLGDKIGSDLLTIEDDPTIPRGLGSSAWDDDLMVARPRTILRNGVLENHYVGLNYGRKLKREPTTGSMSNWILPVGDKSWQEIAKPFPKAIYVTGFLGGNANGLTGDFSFGIRGRLVENGELSKSLSEMNVTGNLLTIFHQLTAVANDPWLYGSVRSPTLLFEDVQFSGL
jgi:PmbA protein